MKNLNLKLKKIESLSSNWVTGIIDAEGNFSIIKKESKNGYNPGFSFKVTQNYYSYEILVYLKVPAPPKRGGQNILNVEILI